MTTLPLALIALVACNKDKDDTGPEDSTTPVTDDTGGTTGVDCETTVSSLTPVEGDTDVYYRGMLAASFEGDGAATVFTVTDASGAEVALSDFTWSDGNVQVWFRADLAPSTSYTLSAEVCGVSSSSAFTTNEVGTPLTEGNSSLSGRTYVTRLSEATIVDPAVLDPLLGQYLTVPLLFEVTTADEATIDLLGALGYQEDDGSYTQYDLPTWDFPAGDFTDSPYFNAEAEAIVIMYGDIPIPIEDFTLEGSFSADGSEIRYGRATGLGDSRYLGELVNQPGVESAVCELAEAMGVYCQPCSDGEPYCLWIVAEDIECDYVPGLDLVEILAEE